MYGVGSSTESSEAERGGGLAADVFRANSALFYQTNRSNLC